MICSINGGGAGAAGATGATGATGAAGAAGASAWPGVTLTRPVLASFTNHNPGTATIIDTGAGIYITDAASAGQVIHSLYVAAPATPYTFTALVQPLLQNTNNSSMGIGFRSSAGKYQFIAYEGGAGGSGISIMCFDDDATFNSRATNIGWPLANTPLWLRITDDGTNVKFFMSPNGVNFVQLYTVAKASGFLGATGYNQCCFFFNPNAPGATILAAAFLSWLQS